MIPLQILEEITDRSRTAARIETLPPVGVRPAAPGPHLTAGHFARAR
jgi:hypothetical protein